jgi:hypothetical protein
MRGEKAMGEIYGKVEGLRGWDGKGKIIQDWEKKKKKNKKKVNSNSQLIWGLVWEYRGFLQQNKVRIDKCVELGLIVEYIVAIYRRNENRQSTNGEKIPMSR